MNRIKQFGLIALAMLVTMAFTLPAFGGTPSTLKTNVWKKPQIFKHLVRDWPLPGPAGWVVDSTMDDIGGDSSPELAIVDSIPCILWDDSGETLGISHTARLPSNYHSGLTLYFLVSSDTASGTPAIDVQFWINRENSVFDAAAQAEDSAASVLAAVNTTNDVLEVVLDNLPTQQLFKAGDFITIEITNASTHVTANTELKGIAATYNADR